MQIESHQQNNSNFKPMRIDALEDTLKDRITCQHYIQAIQECPFLFKDKKVLCMYSGVGFLTLLCCKAGAKHVYTLQQDNQDSENIINSIVRQNGYSGKVTILRGYLEDIKIEKVDIIVSMWANYTLFYQNKLQKIIYARDHFLIENGLIFPDRATFKIGLIQDEYYYDKKISFWDEVYKINMSCMKQWVLTEPIIDTVDPSVLVTNCSQLFELNLERLKSEQLDFVVQYQLKARQTVNAHALVAWYDLHFTYGPKQNILSTSPFSAKTKYKQSIFYLKEHLNLKEKDTIKGTIACKRAKSDKALNFKISYHHNQKQLVQYYILI